MSFREVILLPYAVDQNAPSKPVPGIFRLSDDPTILDPQLRALFLLHACDDDEAFDGATIDYEPNDYGEITVSYNDVYLYVTFIEHVAAVKF